MSIDMDAPFAEFAEKHLKTQSGNNSAGSACCIAESSSVEEQLDAANGLINFLYESGCIPEYEAGMVQRYLSGDLSQNY